MNTQSMVDPPQAVLEYDFEESIGYWIVLASQAFQKALNDQLAPHGVTYRQSQVLGWLALEGELSQVELAARMMIEPATLVGVLDRMERDQLICRSPAPHDRRRKVIQACGEAEQVWQKVAGCARRVRAQAAQGLSEREIKLLKKTLKKCLLNLCQAQPSDASAADAVGDGSDSTHQQPESESNPS